MTPFKELYGYEELSFVDLFLSDNRVPRDRDLIQQSMNILNALKENLQ